MRIPFISSVGLTRAFVTDDEGRRLHYADLMSQIVDDMRRLPKKKCLIFAYVGNDVPALTFILAAIAAGHAVALLDPALPAESRSDIEHQYRPDVVYQNEEWAITSVVEKAIHPDIALLLSTSGSTGGAKFVKLSLGNLESNAASIAASLRIVSTDVGAAHLPLHYSYGLSVVLSHLVAGASLVLTSRGFFDRDFWSLMRKERASHLPGVPFHYEILERLGFERLEFESLRVLTQAGGHLSIRLRRLAHEFMDRRGNQFFVMYGQTEASPRIATLDHADFESHPESVGKVLPNGRLFVRGEDGKLVAHEKDGAVWYEGPNVMLGYASGWRDLAYGDELNGVLDTGDVGRLSVDGYLTIVGRSKRFVKVNGLRINLDEVERAVRKIHSDSVVIFSSERIVVVLAGESAKAAKSDISSAFGKRYTIPASILKYRIVAEIPVTDRGKVDYQALEKLE
jgi:acyl-coenzyme A synthetase/AMP-(fatty) acid ligase